MPQITAQVIRITSPGGVDRLELVDSNIGSPGPQEIRLHQSMIGVNFLDIYHRAGLYPLAMPAVLGVEAVGEVTAIGSAVTDLQVGDRVVYAGAPAGAYASDRLLPAWRAIKLPDGINAETAAAGFLKGLTVQMLMRRVYAVKSGDWVLVQGAAGGLGTLLCQWAKRHGAQVIGTVSSPAKAELARANGADHVIIGRDADFAAEVARMTDGRLADVAYDGIGGGTLLKTLDCVRPFGTVASIGQAAGPIPKLAVEEIGPRRSLIFARPSVMGYINDQAVYRAAAADVLSTIEDGLYPTIGKTYDLLQAAEAQRDLEHGRNLGSLILKP
jgi:NADPH2:quinone reductase